MKKICLVLLLPIIFVLSCSKNNDDNYHFSFVVNGVAKSYTLIYDFSRVELLSKTPNNHITIETLHKTARW